MQFSSLHRHCQLRQDSDCACAARMRCRDPDGRGNSIGMDHLSVVSGSGDDEAPLYAKAGPTMLGRQG